MKNYFEILGLSQGASQEEIRGAFRTLVKEFHPDLNPSPDAKSRFIEIQQAYEFLSDETRRTSYVNRYRRRTLSAEELRRREILYQQWVIQQQDIAISRMKDYSDGDEDEGKFGRALRGVNKLVNIIFLLFCLIIIIVPVWKYAEQQDLNEMDQRSIWFFIFPSIAGLVFAGWGYYYWFVLKSDEL